MLKPVKGVFRARLANSSRAKKETLKNEPLYEEPFFFGGCGPLLKKWLHHLMRLETHRCLRFFEGGMTKNVFVGLHGCLCTSDKVSV